MQRTAEWVFERMHGRDRIIGEGQPGHRGRQCHALSRRKVVRFLHRRDQVLPDQLDGLLSQTVSDRLLAFIGERLIGGDIQLVEVRRGHRFDCVSQRIDPAVGRRSRRTGQREFWIDHGQSRSQIVTEGAHLHLVLGIGEDRRMRDLAPGAGRRGKTD